MHESFTHLDLCRWLMALAHLVDLALMSWDWPSQSLLIVNLTILVSLAMEGVYLRLMASWPNCARGMWMNQQCGSAPFGEWWQLAGDIAFDALTGPITRLLCQDSALSCSAAETGGYRTSKWMRSVPQLLFKAFWRFWNCPEEVRLYCGCLVRWNCFECYSQLQQ